jgi:enamine deaminase RidA (YjgF/YER057c/UK114 family)
VPDDVEEEFRNAWTGIGKLLASCDLGFADIVEYTSYHVGLQATMGDFMAVRDEFLSEPWPAWTAIGITELAVPGAHAEIRITARLKD